MAYLLPAAERRGPSSAGRSTVPVPPRGLWQTVSDAVHGSGGAPTTNNMPAVAHVVPGGASPTVVGTRSTTDMDAELYNYAMDFTDIEQVLRQNPDPSAARAGAGVGVGVGAAGLSFKRIASDQSSGITLYSAPVEKCAIHLMRGRAIIPCSAIQLLRYMDNSVRPQWDKYIRESRMLRELHPPQDHRSSGSNTASASATATPAPPRPRLATSLSALLGGGGSAPTPLPTSTTTPARETFAHLPGQRRVALHYLASTSPVPFVMHRDFELVVSEEIRPNGMAFLKSFSPPLGYVVPMDPSQSRYVRGVLLFSGIVARPFVPATAEDLPPSLRTRFGMAGADFCALDYCGLIDPMGMIPSALVNMCISAQVASMKALQSYIVQHPMPAMATVPPRTESRAGAGAGAAACVPGKGPNEVQAVLRDVLSEEGGRGNTRRKNPSPAQPSQSRTSTDTTTTAAPPPAKEAGKKKAPPPLWQRWLPSHL